jgi:SAM-dependent methyltransferase
LSFSKEWDEIYRSDAHLSIWPWTDLVSLVMRFAKDTVQGSKVLEIGCGAGANVTFFESLNVDYYAIEGSQSMVSKLKEKFNDKANHFHCGDFTKDFHFKGPFDLIIDRGSLPHNTDQGIRSAITLAYETLKPGGKLVSIDWCSDQHYGFQSGDPAEDNYTRTNITEGALAGTGRVHFSDEENIRDILKDWDIELLQHKEFKQCFPATPFDLAFWNLVAVRP